MVCLTFRIILFHRSRFSSEFRCPVLKINKQTQAQHSHSLTQSLSLSLSYDVIESFHCVQLKARRKNFKMPTF
jgi:hypothetical protein